MRVIALAIGLAWMSACSDDVGPVSDASVPDAGGDGGGGDGAVAAPEIPWLDVGPPLTLTPCPAGWLETVEGDVVRCVPHADVGVESCPEGQAHFVGDDACTTVGAPCPSGRFPEGLDPSGPVVYVDSTAAPGGDGSMAAPYASLRDVAWSAIGAGSTVAIAKGTYDGTMRLRAGVRVVGACAAETTLTGDPSVRAVVTVSTAGEAPLVRNVTFSAASELVTSVDDGRALALEGVFFERTSGSAVAAHGAGSLTTLSEVVFRGEESGGSSVLGRALEASVGGRIVAERIVSDQASDIGVLALDEGVIELRDALVDRTLPKGGDFGIGVVIAGGGRLEAERVVIRRSRQHGLLVSEMGSTAALSDVIIERTRPAATGGDFGRGVEIGEGGRVEALRLQVVDNLDVGVFVAGDGSELIMEHALVARTEAEDSTGDGGRGLSVQDGPRVEARSTVFDGNRELGVIVIGAGAEIDLQDAVIRNTRSEMVSGLVGRGLALEEGGRATVARALIDSNRDVGVVVGLSGSELAMTDAVIRDTMPRELDGRGGRGIFLQEGSVLEGARLVIERAVEIGLMANLGARATVSDVLIADVASADCPTCAEAPLGYGTGAVSATLELTRFAVAGAELCGVFVGNSSSDGATETSVDLLAGSISGAAIGACVQVPEFDLGRLSDDITFSDNTTNLDTTTLPVPEPIGLSGI